MLHSTIDREHRRHRQVVQAAVQAARVAMARAVQDAVDDAHEAREPAGASLWPGLSSREHIIGESVSAMMADTVTAPTRVKANSVNSAPVRPFWKPIGT